MASITRQGSRPETVTQPEPRERPSIYDRHARKAATQKKSESASKPDSTSSPNELGPDPLIALGTRQQQERDTMHKTHEAERRDLHGSQRDDVRQMETRQEKVQQEMAEKHVAELSPAQTGAPAQPVAAKD